MTVSIIIPNFNGAKLLEQNLPAVLNCGAEEVIVIDDASLDESLMVLERFTQQIILINHQNNQGYGAGVNEGVTKATSDIVVLLNTDVKPQSDFLQSIKPYFEDNNVFAVSCSEPDASWAYGEFRNGYLHHEPGARQETRHRSLYASGGSAAFSREKFLALGMYDPIFHPFYWEDTDISYRALKRGWDIWWEPNAVVTHERSSTIKKYFNKGYVDRIVQRNELFFIWRNITDKDLIKSHRQALFSRLIKHPGYLKVYLDAMKKKSRIDTFRKNESQFIKRTDKEIFDLLKE